MFISQRVLAAMANQLISVPDFSKIGLPLSDHEHGLNLPCVRIWNLNYLSWCKKMQTNVPQTRETFGDKKMYVQWKVFVYVTKKW